MRETKKTFYLIFTKEILESLGLLPCLHKAKWVQLNGKTLQVLKKSFLFATFWNFLCFCYSSFCFLGYMTKAQKIEDDETSLGKDFGTFKEDFDKFKEDQDLLGEKVYLLV